MNFDEIVLLSALNDYKKFKYNEIVKLLREFQDVKNLFDANQIELERLVTPAKASKFIEFRDKFNYDIYSKIVKELRTKNVSILPFYDKKYPELLKNISNPPLILFHKGSLMDFSNCIAVVGTRNLSHYGHKMARKLCQELAQAGYTIVSGLARGTDTEAHCGALDVGGKTVAIMANNINEIYPPENEKLSLDIIESGALLSEATPFKKLERSNFVTRNRITSGLSKCIVVIESGDTRGTMHQINIASEQQKPIFLLKPNDMNSRFTKDYINFVNLGAILVSSSNEILDRLQEIDDYKLNKPLKKASNMTLEDFK